jgi:hypothetical protein
VSSVSKSEYKKVLDWVKRSRNYIGTSADGENHYVKVDGQDKLAASHYYGDDDYEYYIINSDLYEQWLATYGYDLKF